MIDILTNDYRQPFFPPQYSFVELDMGCGRGKFTLELAKRFPDRLILASDVMLGRLRKLDLKVEDPDIYIRAFDYLNTRTFMLSFTFEG